MLCILKHELNIHKIRPEKSDQVIGLELQVTFFFTIPLHFSKNMYFIEIIQPKDGQLADFSQEFGAWNGSLYFATSYYVSPAFYAAVPLPNDRTVVVDDSDENLHGVLTFGGYANAENVLSNRRRLVDAFPDQIDSAVLSLFQVWSFDPWWKFWSRRNEIHMFRRDDILIK